MITTLFAPDWRNGVPYQRLLAEALQNHGVIVDFLSGYRRVFPLKRLLEKRSCDILHLHWPEAYYPRKRDGLDWFRRARFAYDLRAATHHCVLATTAHNLHAHNRAHESFAERNTRAAHQRAKIVFAHSALARQKLIERFHLEPTRVHVIPHGDLSVTLGNPVTRAEARSALGLGDGPLALMFGAVEPYKGQEEVIRWWRTQRPVAQLALVGQPITPAYGQAITASIAGDRQILTRFGWIPDDQLRLWLSAADIVIFNYQEIFTSGAANLARSWGLPIVLPTRLDTVVLDEPNPYVHRFTGIPGNFGEKIAAALAVKPDFAAAAPWRESCSWNRVARLTADAYRDALTGTGQPSAA
jgi:beta-1,4-mannosyltransferase